MSPRYDDLQFFGEWLPYQRAALAAFERDRRHGNLTTHIVAPPGSGKTLLGVELIRRVGKRALVLAPNQGIQQQWPRAVGQFTRRPAEVAGADVLKPILSWFRAANWARRRPSRDERSLPRLDELLGVSDAPRYLVSRPLADPRRGTLGLLGRVLTRQPPFAERLNPVPADLARNKERAETFARAWRRFVGPGRLVFTQRSEAGRETRAEAASADGGYETLVRDVWV